MRRISAFICGICLLLLCSCQNNSSDNDIVKENSIDLFAMDTYMYVKVYGNDTNNLLNLVKSEIVSLEKLFNVNDSDSDISNINNNNIAMVSNDTISIINKALEISKETNGALDISVYPILKEWGFTTGTYKIPNNDTINNLLQYVDYTQIKVDNNNVSIPQNFAIDLGSVAKGYTSDKIVNILMDNGITSALIDLGGNIQTIGTKLDGTLWSIAVKNPIDIEKNICIIKVDDKAVITSGNYERYFTGEDGKNYCHIIDTKTGKPAENGLISVTIIGDSGLICDALSTSLYVMGKDKAIEYCKYHNDFNAILITSDMEVFITSGIAGNIQMLDNYNYSVIK